VIQRNEKEADKPAEEHDRELIVAYLSYALEDVRALSNMGVFLLSMAIASISDDPTTESDEQPAKPMLHH
jgi:hypothetical protein